MNAGVWYYLILFLMVVFGGYGYRNDFAAGNWGRFGGGLLFFVLVGLLGFRVFGGPVQ